MKLHGLFIIAAAALSVQLASCNTSAEGPLEQLVNIGNHHTHLDAPQVLIGDILQIVQNARD